MKYPEEVKSTLADEESLSIVTSQTYFKAEFLFRNTPKIVFSDAVFALY
jgi:hypothetical protein